MMFKIFISVLAMITVATSSTLGLYAKANSRNLCTGLRIVEGLALVALGAKNENDALKSTKDRTTRAQVLILNLHCLP